MIFHVMLKHSTEPTLDVFSDWPGSLAEGGNHLAVDGGSVDHDGLRCFATAAVLSSSKKTLDLRNAMHILNTSASFGLFYWIVGSSQDLNSLKLRLKKCFLVHHGGFMESQQTSKCFSVDSQQLLGPTLAYRTQVRKKF